MTEESRAAMTQALDAVKLDADMRAMAENAMQHFASVTAEPSAAQIVAESQAEHDVTGGGGGMDAPAGMTVAPMTPEPYHPVSLFRLKFSFGSDGSYSGVTMEEPKFLWNEADEDGNPSTSLKTAGVGTIGLNGTIYLNITLSGEDGAKKFASAQVSMSSDGDISVPLYQLDPAKGVVKDYRHAMISLGVGTPGDNAGVNVSTSGYETAGGGNGIVVTFQPTKNEEDDGDSAGLGIEVEENQPTTSDPGGATIKFQRTKNGQAEGDPVSITISNGKKGGKGDKGEDGKGISDVKVVPSSSEQVVTLTYTDGSFTEIHIPHGLPGAPGAPGQDGETPEITGTDNAGVHRIYADGELIATIYDGQTPTITATKDNGVTTIYANGIAIAQINDGSSGSATLPDRNVVDDVSFSISDGKLKATLVKSNLKTGATSTVTKDVCDVGELDVVVSEDYSTSSHQFTNIRKRIKVIGTPSSASGQTPFTATPLSNE